MNSVDTAYTAVARVHPIKPFDDKPRCGRRCVLATDTDATLKALSYRGLGKPGDHHHVAPAHPEYANIGGSKRDVAKAKALLAEAGYQGWHRCRDRMPTRPAPDWELLAVQSHGRAVEGGWHPRQDQRDAVDAILETTGPRCRSVSPPGRIGRSAPWCWA